jgi:signal transduction histidine kinase
VLMVEDSEDDAALLVRALRGAGYELVSRRVETREGMRAALATEPWDVILCDYRLPGFDALAAIAVAREGGRDLPFIVVSGTVKEETAVEVLKAGAHDFVVKDRLARLVPAIARELKEATVRRERRQALEELEMAVKARDEFLSIASHELKTPLTTIDLQISSLLSLVRSRSLDSLREKLTSKLESAERQVDRLAGLINNLLDVTRITSGHLRVERRNTDLAQIVRDVTGRARQLLSGDGTSLVVDTCDSVDGLWDPMLVETIVSNLVSNAVKFGAGKPVEVILSANPDLATLIVRDHGLGIQPHDQERIFQRFERAVPARHFGGFGIGLWIVRQAVEAHEGGIRVSSALGSGSTFVVELPRGAADVGGAADAGLADG